MIRDYIEARLKDAPKPAFRFPLAYPNWGADEIMAALDCLCDQRTTMWTGTQAFEEQFAEYLGKPDDYTTEAVMVNSGSSADLVMMMAAVELGILNPGDEILIPAVTWPTQVWAAVQAGLAVRFVDVDVHSLNTTPAILGEAITSKTKAVFLVHLMGSPCDMAAVESLADRENLWLFEDCCEALGAEFAGRKVGTFATVAAFSFFASHHISTMEGGMIATMDTDFAETCRMLRAHGWARDLKHPPVCEDPRYHFVGKGFNFRPTELQAAFGRIQLEKLPEMNRQRNESAELLRSWLDYGIVEPLYKTHHLASPAWFAFPIVLRPGTPRKAVTDELQRNGIDTRPIVGGNLIRHPAFAKYPEMAPQPLPGADAIHERGFYVGLPPTRQQIEELADILSKTLKCCPSPA